VHRATNATRARIEQLNIFKLWCDADRVNMTRSEKWTLWNISLARGDGLLSEVMLDMCVGGLL